MEIRRKLAIVSFSIIAIVIASSFSIAYAIDNNCLTNINFIFQAQVSLGCFDERIDALENAEPSSGSETTECINLASQYQIILNSTNGNCYVRSLANGTNITLVTNSTHIAISASSGGSENTTAINLGSEIPLISANVFKQEVGDQLQFKTIFSHDSNTLTFENWNATHIRIRNTSPESTTCGNIGTFGQGLQTGASTSCDFKKILQGTGISLSSNSTNVIITNTLPESTTCNNLGNGAVQLCSGGNVNIDSIIDGNGITITDTTDDWTISSPYGSVCQVYQSVTKTNVGTSYVDAYVSAFDMENACRVDFNDATQVQISYLVDYVGTGMHQVRWVDAGDNTIVIRENGAFNVDCDACLSTWTNLPAGVLDCIPTCSTIVEMQIKSTVAGDDPIVRGYIIWIR